MAALEHRLNSGAGPCPVFGIWRPYGQRLARQLKLTVHHITPGGDYVPYEVAGPPSFAEWLAAFRVFSVATRALQAASHTRLLMYQGRIQKLNDAYGHVCWWLVAQADQRMRGEHLERIRRRAEEERASALAAGAPHPFGPEKPWDYCFKAAAADRSFWEEELDRKCMLLITHLKSQRQLMDNGHVVDFVGSNAGLRSNELQGKRGRADSGQGQASRARQPAKQLTKKAAKDGGGKGGKAGGKGRAKQPDGRWRVSESGVEICYLWSHSEAGCADVCANSRAHICEWCRSAKHRSVGCPNKPSGWTP